MNFLFSKFFSLTTAYHLKKLCTGYLMKLHAAFGSFMPSRSRHTWIFKTDPVYCTCCILDNICTYYVHLYHPSAVPRLQHHLDF